MIQREKENAAPSRWAISAKANVWTPLYIYIYIFPQTALESVLVPRRFKFSQSQPRVNIITFPPAESRAASQEGFCVSSVFLQQRTISCRRWVKNVLITNQLFCFRIDETFLHLFLFASTNRLLLLLLLTNVPVDSDTELILTDWLYWTVTQRLQTLRGDCETKTKTFIHPEQRGGKLHNSGKSQCVFERQWDSKREKERDEHLKHKTFSDVRGDKDVPVHFRCWDDGGAWRWRGCRRLFTRKYFRSHKWIIL